MYPCRRRQIYPTVCFFNLILLLFFLWVVRISLPFLSIITVADDWNFIALSDFF